jgi:hypothetical protein
MNRDHLIHRKEKLENMKKFMEARMGDQSDNDPKYIECINKIKEVDALLENISENKQDETKIKCGIRFSGDDEDSKEIAKEILNSLKGIPGIKLNSIAEISGIYSDDNDDEDPVTGAIKALGEKSKRNYMVNSKKAAEARVKALEGQIIDQKRLAQAYSTILEIEMND